MTKKSQTISGEGRVFEIEEEEEQYESSSDKDGEDENNSNDIDIDDDIDAGKPKKVHKLSLTATEDFNKKLKKRGVLYMARIPPKMTPTKVKSLLSEFGEVTRVYLVEEDATVRKRRKKEFGGSGGKRYIEGWVEFTNKRKAQHVAQSLNNTPISNHKRNPHYGTDQFLFSYCNSVFEGIDESAIDCSVHVNEFLSFNFR